MKKRKDDGYDLPELTAKMFRTLRPAREVHPKLVEAYVRSRGRPPKEKKKIPVTLRLDADVVKALRASGPGWQTRTNALLARLTRKSAAKRSLARR
jgi:uncharacterized protein (DUF4415 family)